MTLSETTYRFLDVKRTSATNKEISTLIKLNLHACIIFSQYFLINVTLGYKEEHVKHNI